MGKPMRNCGRKANWLECDLVPALDMPSGHRWHTAQPGAREGIEKTLTIALKLDKIKRTKHKFKMESLVEIEEKKARHRRSRHSRCKRTRDVQLTSRNSGTGLDTPSIVPDTLEEGSDT